MSTVYSSFGDARVIGDNDFQITAVLVQLYTDHGGVAIFVRPGVRLSPVAAASRAPITIEKLLYGWETSITTLEITSSSRKVVELKKLYVIRCICQKS